MPPIPVLLVHEDRCHYGNYHVVFGPAIRSPEFLWLGSIDREIAIYPPPAYQKCRGSVSQTDDKSVSWEVMFGFDPFTTEFPALRQLQHYSSSVVLTDRAVLSGCFLVPAECEMRIVEARMYFDFDGIEPVVQELGPEVAQLRDAERVLFSCSDSAVVSVPAHQFSKGRAFESQCEVVIPIDAPRPSTLRLHSWQFHRRREQTATYAGRGRIISCK